MSEASLPECHHTSPLRGCRVVRAEGMNIPPLAIYAVPNGEKAVEALVI